jgi:hypothetical protein
MTQGQQELHLMIIWNRGLAMRQDILADLAANFQIVDVLDVEWPRKDFARNISRFYGKKLPDVGRKVRECGEGPFTLVTFIDAQPQYEERSTNAGVEQVNARIFDLKKSYRERRDSDFSVHATNSPEETRRDIFLLLQADYDAYLAEAKPWDGVTRPYGKNTACFSGFNDLRELFALLNLCCRYLVLRNYEGLPEQFVVGSHGDIDLLVESVEEVVALLGLEKESESELRVRYYVTLSSGDTVYFDLRSPDDGYYDPRWSRHILDTRSLDARGFYVPDAESFCYTLMYHALIHKKHIAEDYPPKLQQAYARLFPGQQLAPDSMVEVLEAHMLERGYAYTQPQDPSVYFNETNIRRPELIKRLPEKKVGLTDYVDLRLRKNRLQLYLLTGRLRKSKFRFYLSLGGIFKIDISIGRVKDL